MCCPELSPYPRCRCACRRSVLSRARGVGAGTVESAQTLRLVDRSLLVGDVVGRRGSVQFGTVVAARLSCDVKYVQSGRTVRRLASTRLRPVHRFFEGQLVLLGRWLGRVRDFTFDVGVRMRSGARCIVRDARIDELVPDDEEAEDACPYYPGMRVLASRAVWRRASWTQGSWKAALRGKGANLGRVCPGESCLVITNVSRGKRI